MKAMLFYEDKGTFSEDVSEIDTGPPYVPPKLWNTPMQYENRSNSMLVTVEVTGEPVVERKLEFIASYVPSMRESGAIVVRRVVTVHLPLKAGERDSFHAGFWLNQTGCNPVRLSARIIGRKEAPAVKKVVRFGCGE